MDFQTPPHICEYMVGLLPKHALRIYEPTPGKHGLVRAVQHTGRICHYPEGDFWLERFPNPFMQHYGGKYDAVVMNPPFTPNTEAWRFTLAAMDLADIIIALLPWMLLINSQKRMQAILDYGLCSITNLPRNTFPNSRVQCCVLRMDRKLGGSPIEFINYKR